MGTPTPGLVKNVPVAIECRVKGTRKGGGFKHIMDGEIDGMGTEQAYYALTAWADRFLLRQDELRTT